MGALHAWSGKLSPWGVVVEAAQWPSTSLPHTRLGETLQNCPDIA